MDSDTGFNAQFNMAVAKLYRINNLLVEAHKASITDDHTTWKLCLDAVYREVWAYAEKSDKPDVIKKVKDMAQASLLNYLRWQGQNSTNPTSKYADQARQVKLESVLDEYERLLVQVMKSRGMDMPGNRDLRMITQQGQI